jgi:hypothetical protein
MRFETETTLRAGKLITNANTQPTASKTPLIKGIPAYYNIMKKHPESGDTHNAHNNQFYHIKLSLKAIV